MSRKRRKKNRATSESSAVSEVPAPAANSGILLGVIACFVLSGFAALLYQTAWMRQFSVVFGTSELAVATVLSAYMAGLALGAAIAGRFVDRVTRPVLFYGLLEAGIAISALAVPLLLALANVLYVGVLGNQPEPPDASGLGQSLFYLIVGFIVLAIPTGCMGATLPLLTKYVVNSDDQIGPRVGMLYAFNTVGAVGGTVTAGFLLIPWLGLRGTVWVGVFINVLVFFIAASLARAVQPSQVSRDASVKVPPDAKAPLAARPGFSFIGSFWVLPLMLLSGANTFTYEVLWTRLLGHILGGSVAAFSTMLASFLAGIAIGSAIAARFATNAQAALTGLVVSQGGIAVTSLLIYESLSILIPESAGLRGNVPLAMAVLLPATLFIGATFPFAVRILARDRDDAAPASARVYAWNTCGAIVGAAIAGFILIPLLKYEGAIQLAVTMNVALGLAASLLIFERRYRTALAAGIGLVVVGLVYRPEIPEEILRTSPMTNEAGGEIRFYEVGRSATVLVLEESGFFNLRTNGLPEASTNLQGAPPYQHNQRLLSTVPVLARPDASEMLIVGFGAGVAVEGVPPSIDSIDVIELEPKVIDANRFIAPERQIDPLVDARVNVIINDARSALALTSKRYDAIVSQPSHPWTAGASHLYTHEFISLAKEHLNPDGVFLQWMNTEFVTKSLLESLCATILDVFAHVRIYQWEPGVLFFLGSDQPLDIERNLSMTGRPLRDDPIHYLEKGIGSVEDVLTALAMDEQNVERFARNAPILTDDFNRMATESAVAMEREETLTFREVVDLSLPFDPRLQSDSWVHREYPGYLNFGYIAERLEQTGFKKHAVDLASTLEEIRSPEYLVLVGMGLRRQGEEQEAQRVLRAALAADPQNRQVRFALLRPWLNRLELDSTPDYIKELAASSSGSDAAVLAGWRAAAIQDWQALVELDPELARVRPTDQWYLESVKLRADWRIKVTNPEFQPGLAREAQRLIDNAIAIFRDPDFYSMRVAAAFVAGDAIDVIETARRLLYVFDNEVDNAIEGTIDVTPNAIDRKLQQIETVRTVVDQVRRESNIPSYKTEELDRELANIIRRLRDLKEEKLAANAA
jgi:spermidine synthase